MDTAPLRKIAGWTRSMRNLEKAESILTDYESAKDALNDANEAFSNASDVLDHLEGLSGALTAAAAAGVYPTTWADEFFEGLQAFSLKFPTDFGDFEAVGEAYDEAESRLNTSMDMQEGREHDAEDKDDAWMEFQEAVEELASAIEALPFIPDSDDQTTNQEPTS